MQLSPFDGANRHMRKRARKALERLRNDRVLRQYSLSSEMVTPASPLVINIRWHMHDHRMHQVTLPTGATVRQIRNLVEVSRKFAAC